MGRGRLSLVRDLWVQNWLFVRAVWQFFDELGFCMCGRKMDSLKLLLWDIYMSLFSTKANLCFRYPLFSLVS